jgi:hypothetical protein
MKAFKRSARLPVLRSLKELHQEDLASEGFQENGDKKIKAEAEAKLNSL